MTGAVRNCKNHKNCAGSSNWFVGWMGCTCNKKLQQVAKKVEC